MEPPTSSKRALLALAVVALVATAGCLSGPLGSDSIEATETTTEPTDATTAPTGSTGSPGTPGPSGIDVRRADPATAPDLASELPEPTDCGDAGWVSYWGTGDMDALWQEPGELRVGWTVPANRSILFVAFDNATAVGTDHVQYDQPVTADGDAVPTNATTGEHRYAVVMVHDVDGDGEYDPGSDRPCAGDDGGIVTTDWLWVDWGDEN